MRLALNLSFLGPRSRPADLLALTQEAERLGFDSVWIGEKLSSDAPTMLAWLAAQTTSIGLGSAIMQIPGRSAAMTAMTAATLDTVSDGRFRLGLGLSGPLVSQGWHRVPFARPLARTRDYLDVVRAVLDKRPMAVGAVSPLRLEMRPVRRRVPTYLAALGLRNIELAGELADGWLALFLDPGDAERPLAALTVGRARAGVGLDGFDVVATVPAVVGPDIPACVDLVRGYVARYLGAMGSDTHNFYYDLAVRMGYGDGAGRVRDHYREGRRRDALAAVPPEFVDATSLLGPVDRIAGRLRRYADAGVTTLMVMLFPQDLPSGVPTLRAMVEALRRSGVAGHGDEMGS